MESQKPIETIGTSIQLKLVRLVFYAMRAGKDIKELGGTLIFDKVD